MDHKTLVNGYGPLWQRQLEAGQPGRSERSSVAAFGTHEHPLTARAVKAGRSPPGGFGLQGSVTGVEIMDGAPAGPAWLGLLIRYYRGSEIIWP